MDKNMISAERVYELLTNIKTTMDDRFDQMDQKFEQIDQRFESIDRKFEQIDQRFESIDRKFEQIDQRFESIDRKFEQIDQRFASIDQRFEGIDYQLRQINTRLSKIEVSLENTIIPNIKTLADGHDLQAEKLIKIDAKLEKVDKLFLDMDVVKLAIRHHSYEIDQLKEMNA